MLRQNISPKGKVHSRVINTRVLSEEDYFLYRIIYFALSVTLRVERRPNMLENKVLSKYLRLRGTGGDCMKKPRGLYTSPNIIRVSS